MVRKLVGSLVALALCLGAALAEEIKGKFVKYDAARKVVVLSINDKDTEITVTEETKVLTMKGDPSKQGLKYLNSKGVKADGVVLVVKTEKKDGKEVAVEIKPEKAK